MLFPTLKLPSRENIGANPLIIERFREKRDDQVSLAKVPKEKITDIS